MTRIDQNVIDQIHAEHWQRIIRREGERDRIGAERAREFILANAGPLLDLEADRYAHGEIELDELELRIDTILHGNQPYWDRFS